MAATPKKSKVTVGERLRSVRHGAGLTYKELSKKVGYSVSTLSGVEHGHDQPSLRLLLNLSDVLRIDLVWLTTGNGEMVSGELAMHRLIARTNEILRELEVKSSAPELNDPASPLFEAANKLRAGLDTLAKYQKALKQAQARPTPKSKSRELIHA